MFKFIRDWRRKRLLDRSFPSQWHEHLERLSFVDDLDEDERERFEDRLKVFVWEKQWIAAGGLEEVTEEMKVVIAACAARVVRNLPIDAYDRLTEVVVYPASFTGDRFEHSEILGLAHQWGTVVLAWDAVRKGIATPNDSRDTAIHEFAHALDVADGLYDGTPLLETGADYRDWVRVLGEHYSRLVERPHGQFLDEYGAKNEAEFFAVATEAFFEQPRTLRRRAPELYEQLRNFFELDPA
jgi:Mlc titration factor MtfA (ptsG expression regulator)